MSGKFNEIYSSLMPGVTFQQSSCNQKQSFHDVVLFNCLQKIIRTRRIKTTTRTSKRSCHLITSDQNRMPVFIIFTISLNIIATFNYLRPYLRATSSNAVSIVLQDLARMQLRAFSLITRIITYH